MPEIYLREMFHILAKFPSLVTELDRVKCLVLEMLPHLKSPSRVFVEIFNSQEINLIRREGDIFYAIRMYCSKFITQLILEQFLDIDQYYYSPGIVSTIISKDQCYYCKISNSMPFQQWLLEQLFQ